MPQIISQREARDRGLRHYFTGKPCKYGHVDVRFVCKGNCLSCHRRDARQQRVLNPETARRAERRWLRDNLEFHRDVARRSRLAHIDERREEGRLREANRRAQKSASAGTITADDWRVLCERSPHCHWCKTPFTDKRKRTHDHVIPLNRGGSNSLENSVCACGPCNYGKRDRLENPVTGQCILL